jgi:hypothetical protein
MGRTCGTYGRKNDVNKGFLWQKLKRRRGRLGVDGKIILRIFFKNKMGIAWKGFARIKMGTSSGLLRTR